MAWRGVSSSNIQPFQIPSLPLRPGRCCRIVNVKPYANMASRGVARRIFSPSQIPSPHSRGAIAVRIVNVKPYISSLTWVARQIFSPSPISSPHSHLERLLSDRECGNPYTKWHRIRWLVEYWPFPNTILLHLEQVLSDRECGNHT
ncbi:hypothetical protein AVEN_253273-1 [Araneus ventricosus]|uniref:Uncharacterized protein n=1 Tax=Araneus ventricosus TaxID=182803 RepID=A0A4Y2SJJ0_ARAVE|nr:hypothetical protein AVEN_253273-1 [Araneus ventricosus]